MPGPAACAPGVTAVRVPDGHSADGLRSVILERFNMSLGNGLGRIEDRVFRIGHMGDLGDAAACRHAGRRGDGAAGGRHPAPAGGTQAAVESLARFEGHAANQG